MFGSYQSSEGNNHDEPSKKTSWKHVNTLPLPSRSTPRVYRNKTISYACLNMIRTWNWETNEEKSRFIPMEKDDHITTLAAIQRNALVIGTEKGYIYVEKNLSWDKSDLGQAIREILIIGPNHVIVKFENAEKCLFNIGNGTKLVQFEPEFELCRFQENVFASLQNGCVEIKNVDNFLMPDYTRKDKRFVAMRAERGQFILLLHEDKEKFTIWDVEKQLFWEAPLNPNVDSDQFQTLVLIDSKTFIVPGYCSNGVYIEKISYEQAQWHTVDRSIYCGEWKITSMIQVDDSIMYATKTSSSGIHVFDAELCHSFSSQKFTNGGKSDPLALKALDDYVAIEFEKSVCIIKHKKHKKRLFVGEGDFSYTEAFIKKHKNLAREITASEIKTRDDVEREFRNDHKRSLRLIERLISLEEKRVEILYEIDARKLHEHFPTRRFERIHWNCPFGEYRDAMSNGGFKDVILDFFDSSGKIQQAGDRVHITLMQERHYKNVRQKQNPIVLGSAMSGYRLIKKRFFGQERYPGYEHVKSGGLSHHSSDDHKMREFVFEKVPLDVEFTIKKPHRINHESDETTQHDSTDYYFECSTDEDSSSDDESYDERKNMNYRRGAYHMNGRGFHARNTRATNGSLESSFGKTLYVTNSKYYNGSS